MHRSRKPSYVYSGDISGRTSSHHKVIFRVNFRSFPASPILFFVSFTFIRALALKCVYRTKGNLFISTCSPINYTRPRQCIVHRKSNIKNFVSQNQIYLDAKKFTKQKVHSWNNILQNSISEMHFLPISISILSAIEPSTSPIPNPQENT